MTQRPATVVEILSHHVVLTREGIDRLFLNAYVPQLQHDRGVLRFFCEHRGNQVASSVLMAPMSRDFVRAIEAFCRREWVPLLTFEKHQRKEDTAKAHLATLRCTVSSCAWATPDNNAIWRATATQARTNLRTKPWRMRVTNAGSGEQTIDEFRKPLVLV